MSDKTLAEQIKDRLLPILGDRGSLRIRAMFGGYAVRVDDITIGFAAWGKFYFRMDDTCKKDFEEVGGEQFTYIHKSREKPTPMPYMTIGDEDKFDALAEIAYDVAKKAKKSKK